MILILIYEYHKKLTLLKNFFILISYSYIFVSLIMYNIHAILIDRVEFLILVITDFYFKMKISSTYYTRKGITNFLAENNICFATFLYFCKLKKEVCKICGKNYLLQKLYL